MFFQEGNISFIEKNGVWVFEQEPMPKVIITIPHDGLLMNNFGDLFRKRVGGISVRDINIWPVARDILSVTKVNVVRGLIPRHFIDYNRSELEAAEDKQWLGSYNTYHSAITNLLRCAEDCHGAANCLLLDLHGFKRQPDHGEYDVILGTGNRTTVLSEVDKQLAEFLETRNYRVFLPKNKPLNGKADAYNGAFTIRHYFREHGISAIQIEVNRSFRTKEGEESGKRLSSDFAEFLTNNFSVTS